MRTTLLLLSITLLTVGGALAQEETEPAVTDSVPTATAYASIDEAAEAVALPWYNFWGDPKPIVVDFYSVT
jgi:hypothetical protein